VNAGQGKGRVNIEEWSSTIFRGEGRERSSAGPCL